MNYKKVVVAGGGVLGSQIAFQTAVKGFDVTVWLRSEGSIERAKPKFERLHGVYQEALDSLKDLCGSKAPSPCRGLVPDTSTLTLEKINELKKDVETAYKNLKLTTDLVAAAKDADLVIECVAEDPKSKIAFYEELEKTLPKDAVIATNSSTLLPSMFAKYTGRPEKYLALHFANSIWKNNTAEVMGHDGTDKKIYGDVVEFAQAIGMIPLQLKKEQPGYILNSMLVPFLDAAETLLVKGVADPETIDLTWMLATGAPVGPFRILDIVGLTTAYNITMMKPEISDPNSMASRITNLLKEYIDAGKTGINAGEGFYKYK